MYDYDVEPDFQGSGPKMLVGLRPYMPGDIEELVRLMWEAEAWPPGVPAPVAGDVVARWKRGGVQPEVDVTLLPGEAGDFLGYSQSTFYHDGSGRLGFALAVHPTARRKGIGAALFRLIEGRARSLGARYMNTPVFVGLSGVQPQCVRFLEEKEFKINHSYWQMRLDDIQSHLRGSSATGINIRRFDGTQADAERWAELINQAFLEPASAAGVISQLGEPGVSPRGYFFAVDSTTGREIGTSRARIDAQGGKDVGYIGTVGVLPEYRRRGVAEALIEETLNYLAEEGVESATLFVENSNHNARRLYDKLGWHPVYRTDHYWKTLHT